VAAGVAEGTIFRVFPDKDSVIRAAVDLALDATETELALKRIDRSEPFERQVTAAVEILQRRMTDICRLVSAVGGPAVLPPRERPLPDLHGLNVILESEQDRLRFPPVRAARLLVALTVAFQHPALRGDDPMAGSEIAGLFLDGVRGRARPDRDDPAC
jgi:AcrR family transcriptional regulator